MTGVPEIGRAFLARGGKRLRPRICAAAYRHACPDGTADLSALQEAVECFHKASLVHDDIQDGDRERYGQPALWCAYGVPCAIAVGDWLMAEGMCLVDGAAFPNVQEMARLRSRAIRELCEGQGDELCGRGDYVSVCARKTGALFALAAGLGALAAGADPQPYWDWGVAFGVLYQVRDDIADQGATPELRALEEEYVRRLGGLPHLIDLNGENWRN